MCMYACMPVCMYACMHVCMYACMYACMHVCMSACMHVCMYVCVYVIIDVCCDIVVTGIAEELSTVDGRNLAPLSVEGYAPSRSQFNIGVCAVVLGLGGTNGRNLAPPRLLPNIESGGKGDAGSVRRTTNSY